MASSNDAENEYLSCLYDCLAVAVDHKHSVGLRQTTLQSILLEELFEAVNEDLLREPQKVRFQLYGSSAEDLNVDLFPDFDFMISPSADELMIDDELIEYNPSNPLYVRIRGTGHPVLQSCLKENTEYVATSALKNFHPAIFGPMDSFNNANDVVPSVFPTSRGFVSASVKNSMTSPAVKWTLDLSNICRKLRNELKLPLYNLIKGGEESAISTFLSSEDETECFFKHNDSFASEAKLFLDNIPAFRCLTWPMAAQEWPRRRQRKWPSPDVVEKVTREGFPFVVKAPKNGGNPECDFRISFSHAEFLLSREINEIQHECYRCLKTYQRVHLSTEPKSLISFHLKNIFLRTIEETGGEMWIESRRAECMSKLFANLLKALRERHLPHYFVRSYNLFDTDYIEDPAILESLAERVEQIMENPVKFAEELILVSQGKRSSPVQEQEQMNSPSNQLQSELMLLSSLKKKHTERAVIKKVCRGTIKDLIEAVNNADCILESLDPMERTVVENLREMQKEHSSTDSFEFLLLAVVSAMYCSEYTEQNLTDINLRHRVLACVRHVTEVSRKFSMRLQDAGVGPLVSWSYMKHMLNPASEIPFDWNLFFPPGLDLNEAEHKLVLAVLKSVLKLWLDEADNNEDDIPGLGLVEDEKEIILTQVKHFLEALLGDVSSNEDDIPVD